ncbi:hypothetical protein [Flindersiella endophytica]
MGRRTGWLPRLSAYSLRIDPRIYRAPSAAALGGDVVVAIREARTDLDQQARALAVDDASSSSPSRSCSAAVPIRCW